MRKGFYFVLAHSREESRTLRLARCLQKHLYDNGVPFDEIALKDLDLRPIDAKTLQKRDELVAKGRFDDPMFDFARRFAEAENIVVAAPFYDLSFPALLKVYLERVSVPGITFTYEGERPIGLCKAKRAYVIYTAGGSASMCDHLFPYVRDLFSNLYGIKEVVPLLVEGLDIVGNDVEALLKEGETRILASVSLH